MPANSKCNYITPYLNCIIGGPGNITCTDPDLHEKCEIKNRNKNIVI